jgi:hypothetical protein
MKDMTLEEAKVNIGRQVTKKSGKPFKSGSKINTVTNVIEVEVPYKNATIKRAAYKFAEDDSWVTVGMCKTVE